MRSIRKRRAAAWCAQSHGQGRRDQDHVGWRKTRRAVPDGAGSVPEHSLRRACGGILTAIDLKPARCCARIGEGRDWRLLVTARGRRGKIYFANTDGKVTVIRGARIGKRFRWRTWEKGSSRHRRSRIAACMCVRRRRCTASENNWQGPRNGGLGDRELGSVGYYWTYMSEHAGLIHHCTGARFSSRFWFSTRTAQQKTLTCLSIVRHFPEIRRDPACGGGDYAGCQRPATLLVSDRIYTVDAQQRCVYRQHNNLSGEFRSGVADWGDIPGALGALARRPPGHPGACHPTGCSVHELDPKTLSIPRPEAKNVRFSAMLTCFELRCLAVAAGAIIEREVIVREHTPMFAAGAWRRAFFDAGVRWNTPADSGRSKRDQAAGQRKVVGRRDTTAHRGRGRIRVTFDLTAARRLRRLRNSCLLRRQRATYVGFSTAESWAAIAQAYSAIRDQAAAKNDVAAMVKRPQGHHRP